MNDKRRTFLKGTFAAGTVGVAVAAGLLKPGRVLAAWPKSAFEAEDLDTALSSLYDTTDMEASDQVSITAPDIAENGAVVPVTVDCNLDGVDSISLVAVENGNPLTCRFGLQDKAMPYVQTRIKMGQTSDVIAVAERQGKLMMARKEVKVTIGGCGG
jgi:sulfur-oxidizing protein SoxY